MSQDLLASLEYIEKEKGITKEACSVEESCERDDAIIINETKERAFTIFKKTWP